MCWVLYGMSILEEVFGLELDSCQKHSMVGTHPTPFLCCRVSQPVVQHAENLNVMSPDKVINGSLCVNKRPSRTVGRIDFASPTKIVICFRWPLTKCLSFIRMWIVWIIKIVLVDLVSFRELGCSKVTKRIREFAPCNILDLANERFRRLLVAFRVGCNMSIEHKEIKGQILWLKACPGNHSAHVTRVTKVDCLVASSERVSQSPRFTPT
mmetsp:Transcript_32532/g.58888  ORF Transcript_32532/g.58888 Transcript_32532/m.58888 type:complete len:210 (+) Transcript_32532:85-714(+)